MKTFRMLTLAFLAILFVMACNKEQASSSDELQASAADRDCVPTVTVQDEGPGGNYSCPAGFDNTSTRIEIDQTVNPQNDTEGPISWSISSDGKYLSWSGNVCGLVVVVKGATSSNVYEYDADCKAGSGLTAPPKNGKFPQISNITFCWNNCPEENCNAETAFGGNTAGPGSAWWYSFDVTNGACQNIYAGQQLMAGGTVCYDAATSTFDINLGTGWHLRPVSEPVKIQGYTTLPGKRPAAGLFTTYKGSQDQDIPVAAFPYYIVHLDVEYCE